MSKYQDQHTLWHDKPCKNGKPSSNNWLIYTAYAKLLKLPYDHNYAAHYFDACTVTLKKGEIKIYRHPGKDKPPFSFDELLGAYILGFIDYETLKANHFVFHGKGKPMSAKVVGDLLIGVAKLAAGDLVGTLGSIVGAKKPDRNAFWEKEIKEMYQAAFRVNPGQVWFLKKANKANIHEEDRVLSKLYIECTLKSGSPGEKNILWALAKISGQKSLAKKCDPKKNFGKYFPKDHDFNRLLRK